MTLPDSSQEHSDRKSATRQRIVEAAARRFKRDGIDGFGIATVMKDAGLTNGAFYGHFASKDELVAVTVTEELKTQAEVLRGLEPGPARLEHFVRTYLSGDHRDNPEPGSPFGALLDEVVRRPGLTREAYTDGVVRILEDIASHFAAHGPPCSRVQMLGVFALMVGTLQLSRGVADHELADAILENGVRNALALLDGAPVAGPRHSGIGQVDSREDRRRRGGSATTPSSDAPDRAP